MKRVFVLGAGASIGHSQGRFPSINNFFAKASELGITVKENKVLPEYQGVYKYILETFHRDIVDTKVELDIERVMTLISIDIEKGRTESLSETRDRIIQLIRQVLGSLSDSLSGKESEYNKFVSKIKESDTIITFNWDLLLDNILSRNSILRTGDVKNQYYNLVRKLTANAESTRGFMKGNPPYHTYDMETGYYLKLHGSIDWVYCSNETCRAHAKVFPIIEYSRPHYCAECHEEVSYLLIPPVLNKQYNTYPFIRKLWNTATKEIQFAEEMVIWGYSLPSTDFYSDWLLRQKSEQLKIVKIINPAIVRQGKKVMWGRDFRRTFRSLFLGRSKQIRVDYYENFDDYDNQLTINNKYGLKSTIVRVSR